MRTIEHWVGGKSTTLDIGPDRAGVQPGHRRSSRPRSRWPRPPTSTRRCRSPRRLRRLVAVLAEPAGEDPVRLPGAGQQPPRRARRADHRRARQGALRRRAARCSAAWRWSSSPAASRTCSRASTPTRCRPASTSFSFREPLGVVAGITPFNFPVMVPMWMHPVAIACGNTFVLKPSERDPSASMLIARAVAAGRPARRCVQRGARRQGGGRRAAGLARTSRRCPSSAPPRSPATSTSARSATGKRVQALGGAKNHAVVLPDADLDFAADHLVAAAFGSAGERCMAISAAVAVGAAGDRWSRAVADKARAVQGRPRPRRRRRDGPGDHRGGQGPDRGADRHRRRRRAPSSRRRPRAAWSTVTRTASSSARP